MTNSIFDNTPIIIGVGQSVSHWLPEDGIESAPSPTNMATIAAKRAINDVEAKKPFAINIDTLALVRTMADSLPSTQYPLGAPVNAPGALASRLGIRPSLAIYASVGGDTPQALINEMAERIHGGETNIALIAGGEATGAMKVAHRAKIALDWSSPSIGTFEDRGFGPALLTNYEMRHGLGVPTQVYPLFEEAWRRKNNLTKTKHRNLMAELFVPFSKIAASNPYAQFGYAKTEAFLSTPSKENYDISSPYLKWHVAQDAVNQGAAILMTSVSEARRLGVPKEKWIYLHSYAEVRDQHIMERPDLSKSYAMELVLGKVLADSKLTINKITHIDIYSCFPCAVLFAAKALGIDWRDRPLTVTGGLPFFGAAGNNYSSHAIVTMVERLRTNQEQYGLILANGGYMSKEAAGIYSASPKQNWGPISSRDLEKAIEAKPRAPLNNNPERANVIAHTITYYRGEPVSGFAICETDHGRCLAKITTTDTAQLKYFASVDSLENVTIMTKNNVHFLSLPI